MRIEERTLLRRFASCIVLLRTTMQMCSRWWIIAFALVGSFAGRSYAQQLPEEGGREVQLWTGGGHTVPGGTKNTSVWNLGLRYGWILTRPHGPGFLRGGSIAVDAVPCFCLFQPANTVMGGFNQLI
jgi:hypothetical protein